MTKKLIVGSPQAMEREPSLEPPCPQCGALPKNTHYVSPESNCYEQEGDVDCLVCGAAWNDMTGTTRCADPECWCNRTQWKTSTRKSLRRIK